MCVYVYVCIYVIREEQNGTYIGKTNPHGILLIKTFRIKKLLNLWKDLFEKEQPAQDCFWGEISQILVSSHCLKFAKW